MLICDDHSPDASFEIIKSYEQRLKNRFAKVVLLRNEENQGVTRNVNRLLAYARGEYVKIIASDDAMRTDAISRMVAYLNVHPDCGVVIANGVKVAENQHYPGFQSISTVYETAPDFSPEGFLERIARHNEIFAPGAMIRRCVYEKYGYYDESILVEDYEYWLRLLKENVRFGYIHEQLIFYRINSGSMTSLVSTPDLQKRRQRFFFASMQTLKKYLNDLLPGVYAEICVRKIIDERRFAVDMGLTKWEKMLEEEWKRISGRNELEIRKRVYYHYRYWRISVRKALRWYLKIQ